MVGSFTRSCVASSTNNKTRIRRACGPDPIRCQVRVACSTLGPHDTVREGLHAGDEEIWRTGQPQISEALMHDAQGQPRAIAIHKRKIEIDDVALLLHIFRDCTPEKKLQRRLLQLQTRFQAREETIHEQEQELRERATPVLEIGQGIVAVPLSGRLDAFRLHDLTHDVLTAIQSLNARHVLLDLTGVHHADKIIADHLLKIVRAAQLLGSNCALCSVHPTLATFFAEYPKAAIHTLRVYINLRDALAQLQHPSTPPAVKSKRAK